MACSNEETTKAWPPWSSESRDYCDPLAGWAKSLIDKLRGSTEFADMTVVAHGKEHKLHKIIACSQSGFFDKAIRNFKEADTGIVHLAFGNPDTIDAMLTYLTTAEYEFKEEEEEEELNLDQVDTLWFGEIPPGIPEQALKDLIEQHAPVKHMQPIDYVRPQSGFTFVELANASDTPVVLMKLNRFVIRRAYLLVEIPNRVRVNHEQKYAEGKMRFHAEMYCTADFYAIPTLKPLSKSKLQTLANKYAIPLSVIKYIYESTPDNDRGLRDIAVDWSLYHIPHLVRKTVIELDGIFEIPLFARDVFAKEAKANGIILREGKVEILDAMVQFLKTGDYEAARVFPGGECPKLSKNRKKKLKAATKNAAVVGNVMEEREHIAAAAKLTQEREVVQSKVSSTLFHIDIYTIAAKDFCMQGFPNIIQRVYETPPENNRGLRNFLAERAVREISFVALQDGEPESKVFEASAQSPPIPQRHHLGICSRPPIL
ncbi:hypothetical protein EG327_005866 [Venturia inaequalis]|uniref:BTB domain-containing protein n=1 Tax=Venturia inaequalis TaxID=5025 RepID=A0A8H3VUY6_VENIN|nr:hypothetical protein EG327_005866 [Venturia inaequalis]